MGAKIPTHFSPEDWTDMKGVAEYTGLRYAYVRALNTGHEVTTIRFPKPFAKVGGRPIFFKPDIVDWWEAHTKHRVEKDRIHPDRPFKPKDSDSNPSNIGSSGGVEGDSHTTSEDSVDL